MYKWSLYFRAERQVISYQVYPEQNQNRQTKPTNETQQQSTPTSQKTATNEQSTLNPVTPSPLTFCNSESFRLRTKVQQKPTRNQRGQKNKNQPPTFKQPPNKNSQKMFWPKSAFFQKQKTNNRQPKPPINHTPEEKNNQRHKQQATSNSQATPSPLTFCTSDPFPAALRSNKNSTRAKTRNQPPTFNNEPTKNTSQKYGVWRLTQFCWVGKHINSIRNQATFASQRQPNPPKRGKKRPKS